MGQPVSPEALAERWAGVASYARTLEQELANAKPEVAPEDELRNYVAQQTGAYISEALGFGRRPGSRFARSTMREKKNREMGQRKQLANSLAARVLGDAQSLREVTSPILDGRSASSLRRRLAEATNAARPETRLRRVAATADWVQARLTGAQGSRTEHGMALVSNIESKIRDLISEVLGQSGKNWWKATVPPDVLDRAEARWRADGERLRPIDYVDFPDLSKIIARRSNRMLFKEAIGEVDVLLAKLAEVSTIRNHLAHSRPLTDIDRKKLSLYSEEFGKL